MKTLRVVFLVMLIAAVVHPAAAQVLGPTYPAPGGNNFGSSGNAETGTATYTYSSINPSAFNQLWWTITPYNVCSPSGCGSSPMAFSNYNSGTGIATWVSTTNWTFTGGLGSGNVPTEFVLNIGPTALSGAGLPAGIPSSLGVALPVTGTGFSVDAQWLACPPSGCEPVWNYYEGLNGGGPGFGGGYQVSTDGEFYYTATPEPSSFLLMGGGLIAMGGILRRRIFGR